MIMSRRSAENAARPLLGLAFRYDQALLALLAGAALISRFLVINRKSIWIDEAISWQSANVSLRSMFDMTAQDKHPPLYYGVLHFWVKVFGNSEASLRAPSAILGAATILLLAVIGWRAGGRLLGLAAAVLLLFNPAHLAASQEARMYALAGFLAVAASAMLASYITKPSVPRFLGYAALMSALIYTHYNGLMVVGVHGLIFVGYGVHELTRKRSVWILTAGLGTLAVLGLAYVPWFSTFRATLDAGAPYYIPAPSVSVVRATSQSLLGLDAAKAFWLAFSLPLLGLGVFGLVRRRRDPLVVATGAVAFVIVAQILFSMVKTPVFSVRQAAPYTPGLAFVMALGLVEMVSLAKRWHGAAAAGYAAIALFGVAMLMVMAVRVERTYTGPSRQDWRSVAADLSGTSKPVYIAPGFQSFSLSYYTSTLKVTPLWQKDLNRIAQGGEPLKPEKTHTDSLLIVQGGFGQDVIPAFKRYFYLSGLQQYSGDITTYVMHPLDSP